MARQIQGSQRDFSFGEVDPSLKRADEHPAHKGGLRQMANARILNSGTIQDRPGRRALFPTANSRTEEFTIMAGQIYKIGFGAGRFQIINSAGIVVVTFTNQGNGAVLPWQTSADIRQIDYAILGLVVYITFGHSMRPQVLTFDGVATWVLTDFAEAIFPSGQKRTPFYRISPQNITMLPSATIGNITLTFSQPIVTAALTGTRMRFCNRQMLLGAVINNTQINATVVETLPPGLTLALSVSHGNFTIGDLMIGEVSGAKGIVTAVPTAQAIETTVPIGTLQIGDAVTGGTSGATGVVSGLSSFNLVAVISLSTGTVFLAAEIITGAHGSITAFAVSPVNLNVQMLQNDSGNAPYFQASEAVASPSATATLSGITVIVPQAVSVWDDEVINAKQGYPGSVFADQFRVGFCDFPSIPGGILWSAINSVADLYANDASSPDNAIFEIAPAKVRVLYVVPGPESSEFVMCDTRIYYIPISTTNPLVPGSVGFQLLSGDGCAPVKPRIAQEAILYVNAGQNSVRAIIATGAYTRPFNTKDLSEFHQHLFSNIIAIAAPNADGTFNERYAYVLNGNGSIVVGKYSPESLQTNLPVIGWGPWSGVGVVSWIAAWNSDVLFTATYFGAGICEILDDTQYLDCAVNVNAPATAMAPLFGSGQGPLWFIPNQSVTLIDQVTRFMGTYQIDPNGFIIAQQNGGENLAIASLVAGQPWTMTVEPFTPVASPGTDLHQRMTLRQIAEVALYVINSTGFLFATLFSSKQTATSPPLGTMMQNRRVPAWNMGDDPTKPPLLRETVETYASPGSSFDPRCAIIKDTPGPLEILEIAIEVAI